MATTTEYGGTQGRVGLVFQNRPQIWNIESTRFHGPNVASYKVVTQVPVFS